jgi:hypothetical protein
VLSFRRLTVAITFITPVMETGKRNLLVIEKATEYQKSDQLGLLELLDERAIESEKG